MRNLDQLLQDMRNCAQSADQSVLDHGYAVWNTFKKLMAHLNDGAEAEDWWRIPTWLTQDWSEIRPRMAPMHIMEEYLIYHDCGKPYCLQIDADGKRHFPNHAQISKQTWLDHGGNAEAAELMGLDMEAHLLKADNMETFIRRPQAMTLLISAIAETHSNAMMFGGTNSDSFKIKIKNLDKRGRQAWSAIRLQAPSPSM